MSYRRPVVEQDLPGFDTLLAGETIARFRAALERWLLEAEPLARSVSTHNALVTGAIVGADLLASSIFASAELRALLGELLETIQIERKRTALRRLTDFDCSFPGSAKSGPAV
jgi:hypothetical protein